MRNSARILLFFYFQLFFFIFFAIFVFFNRNENNEKYNKIEKAITLNRRVEKIPYKTFEGFLIKIQELESNRNHLAKNGQYLGLYQMGRGIRSVLECCPNDYEFLYNVNLQHDCMIKSVRHYKIKLTPEIQKYDNKIIDGIKMTESSIIALAHLSGISGARKYLYSNNIPEKDQYGNPIRRYVLLTANYDVSLESIINVDTNKLNKNLNILN